MTGCQTALIFSSQTLLIPNKDLLILLNCLQQGSKPCFYHELSSCPLSGSWNSTPHPVLLLTHPKEQARGGSQVQREASLLCHYSFPVEPRASPSSSVAWGLHKYLNRGLCVTLKQFISEKSAKGFSGHDTFADSAAHSETSSPTLSFSSLSWEINKKHHMDLLT